MGFILAIVSLIISAILFPFGIAITFFINIYKKRWMVAVKRLDKQFLSIAVSVDASGNVICKDLLNLTLIKKKGYKFGKRKETISSVLGKNEKARTLSRTGKVVCYILNKIDFNHCLKSIDILVD
jgi:8-oxo-dGTP diphosphatase